MAKRLTLFIEDTDIKLLVVNGERVENWASIALEPGLVSSGVIQDEEKVASLLQRQLKLLRIRTGNVILGLSGLNSLYRIISLPAMPDAMLPEAVRHEAERVLPLSLSEVYLASQPILGGAAGERRIFLVAFPRNATDSLIRTVRRVGLRPYLMDSAPLALSHTVGPPRAIVVNVRGIQMDIIVMADMVPQVIRSLQLPGEGEPSTEKLADIVEEVERTVAFYNTSQQDKQLDSAVPLFVSGDLAELQDSWPLLSSRLGRSVSLLPSPLASPDGFDSSQFMVNIGLSLKSTSPKNGAEAFSLIDFNVLPEIYRPQKPISIINIVAPVVMVGIISLIVLTAYMMRGVAAQSEALGSQIVSIQGYAKAQQAEIPAIKEKLKKLEGELKPLEVTAKTLNDRLTSLKTTRERLDEDSHRIVELLPETSSLTSVSGTKDGITVSGNSPDIDGIYTYAVALRATNRFAVTISSITLKEEEVEGEEETKLSYDFVFSLKAR